MSFNDDLISRIEKLENTIETQNIYLNQLSNIVKTDKFNLIINFVNKFEIWKKYEKKQIKIYDLDYKYIEEIHEYKLPYHQRFSCYAHNSAESCQLHIGIILNSIIYNIFSGDLEKEKIHEYVSNIWKNVLPKHNLEKVLDNIDNILSGSFYIYGKPENRKHCDYDSDEEWIIDTELYGLMIQDYSLYMNIQYHDILCYTTRDILKLINFFPLDHFNKINCDFSFTIVYKLL